MVKPLFMSVIGGSDADPETQAMAEQVGWELANRGATVLCGWLDGVMEAICRGAKSARGITMGILPGPSPSDANPYVDIPVCTAMGYSRNVIVVKSGRAVIAIDRSYGTLSEIAHALGEDIPVVGLNTWFFSISSNTSQSIVLESDPVDAAEKAIEAAQTRNGVPSR